MSKLSTLQCTDYKYHNSALLTEFCLHLTQMSRQFWTYSTCPFLVTAEAVSKSYSATVVTPKFQFPVTAAMQLLKPPGPILHLFTVILLNFCRIVC